MKKNFLLLFVLAFLTLFSQAAAPTASSSNLTFNSIDGKSFGAAFTAGNGANRIVVVKEGSPVVGLPQNGVQYNAASQFGTAGTAFTAPGEYVVARTGWSSFSVENLKPGTVYYLAIFEVNGSGASSEYLMLPLQGSQSTAVPPTVQTSGVTVLGGTGNTLNLSWTKGNGAGRVLLARKGAPVDAVPTDLSFFWGDENFGAGGKFGADNYAVYRGGGTTVTVKNLEPNTTYHFAAFEYNGGNQPVHLVPGSVTSGTTAAGPSVAPSSIGFGSIEGNRMTVGFTQGNGTRRLIIARKGSPVTAVPVNGTAYTDGAFGFGTQLQPGEYVVGNTAGTGVVVTGLDPATTYHFRVFEFDVDKAGNTYYLTTSFASKSGSTASAPATLASNVRLSANTGTTASISFTPGNGGYRMLVLKEGSAVDAAPVNLLAYSGSNNFGAGTSLGNGNFASHWGTNGSVFNIGGLAPGKTYHAALYEFNGYNYPVYSAAVPFTFALPLEPTTASSNLSVQSPEAGRIRLVWTAGNGSKRVVIARKASNTTARLVDGTSYTANAAFGQGQELAPGEFVLYNGDSYYFDVTNLELATTYHFSVFEYNVDGNGRPDYLTSAYPVGTATTLGYPTTQLTLSPASSIQAGSVTINFTKGNGENRVFFMSENNMQTFFPADYVKYANNTYGTSAALVADGIYCINNTSGTGSFGMTNLKPNTTYYVRAFEYNGVNSPAYLRTPVPAISFTTPDVAGAVVPTLAATNGERLNEDGNKLTLKWTNGNGEKRIVVMRRAAFVDFVPASATAYSANAAFGSGSDLGGGQFVVYNGSGNSVDVTGLLPSETYYATVYEYSGTTDLLRYLTSSKLTISASTVFAPTMPVSNVNAGTGNGRVTLSWTAGNGAGRLVVMKEASTVTAQPADLSVYPANAVFKNGSQMALGEYVVYVGSGSSVTVTGLSNKTYHYSIFEYNGNAAPVYNRANAVSGSVVVSSTLPVSLIEFSAKEATGKIELKWATAQEVNSHHFVVERSVDGVSFSAIGSAQSAGNSTTRKDYSFTDHTLPASAKLYYRLQQVDNDGQSVYSSVQVVDVKKTAMSVSVYPNPFVSNFSVSLPSTQQGRLTVYDVSGKVQMVRNVKNGGNVDASKLSSGTYFITVESGNEKQTFKLLKQ